LKTVAAPADLQELLDSCREQAGIERALPVRVSDGCGSPAVYGLTKPAIVIPKHLAEALTPPQLRQVLLHELVHIRRHDIWVNQLQIILQALYWYHPLVWLASATIRRVREEAVDETVAVMLGPAAASYAETLVAVARLAITRLTLNLGFIGIMEPKAALKQRVARLLEHRPPERVTLSWTNKAALAVFAAILLPMARPQTTAQSVHESSPAKAGVEPSPAGEIVNEQPGRSAQDSQVVANVLLVMLRPSAS
jgi:bla regulator protein BlaR1